MSTLPKISAHVSYDPVQEFVIRLRANDKQCYQNVTVPMGAEPPPELLPIIAKFIEAAIPAIRALDRDLDE